MTLLERKRDISAESLFTAAKEGGGGGRASAAVKNIKENPGVMQFFFFCLIKMVCSSIFNCLSDFLLMKFLYTVKLIV